MEPNFNQGINPAGYGGGIQNPYGNQNGQLLGMLQQLLNKHLAPQSFGTNGYQIPQNSNQIGYISKDGSYHAGTQ